MAPTMVCAHRGDSAHFPENTLLAIRKGCDAGVPMTEIDVHRTADGHVVVMHDHAVDRTTNGSGPIAEMTLEQIRALDAGSRMSPDFAGERVPLLAEVLELCRERGMFQCIEIKQDGIAPDVARVIDECRMGDDVIVISFNFDTVVAMRELRPAIAAGWLTGQLDPAELDTVISRCLSHGIMTVSAHYSALTPEVVERCRLRGMTVYAWTIDEGPIAKPYAEMGVDVIASNDPAMVREYLAGLEGRTHVSPQNKCDAPLMAAAGVSPNNPPLYYPHNARAFVPKTTTPNTA